MKDINNFIQRSLKQLSTTVLASIAILLMSCDYSYDLAEANSKEDNTPPTAFFGASVRGDDEWNIADFANGSISASNFVWDFGDGETSTDLEPSHSFPGLLGVKDYTVTLKATDGNGLTDVYTSIVTIEDNGQALGDLELYYDLINNGVEGEDLVTVHSYSKQQDDGGKSNFATNTLDKDESTTWTADDLEEIPEGDFKADGEFVIFDLAETSELEIIRFRTDSKPDSYGYQIWTSNTGTENADFTQLLPAEGGLMFTEAGNTDFQIQLVSVSARYVKLIGFGRFNAARDTRTSVWTNFSEIEFFKTKE